MIPKIIHYCWFGGNPLPELAQKCIASWRKCFPYYEIKEWNEANYDVHKISYTSEAYNAKKYAFVSDYARFDILYQYGGIYFDTDVEVIKPFENILKNGGFMGFESLGSVAAGLGIGCNAGLGVIYEILGFYSGIHFLNTDGSYNMHTVVEYVTEILKKHGLKMENTIQHFDGFTVYPIEYFCPFSLRDYSLNITDNTHSIHHYEASWISKSEKKWKFFRKKSIKKYGYRLGSLVAFCYFFFICIINSDTKIFIKILKSKF
jgi:hypothetical protein